MERYKESNLFKGNAYCSSIQYFRNGRSLTEPQEITNAFNKFFVNVATDIQSSIFSLLCFFMDVCFYIKYQGLNICTSRMKKNYLQSLKILAHCN